MRKISKGVAGFFSAVAVAGCSKPPEEPKTVKLPDTIAFRAAPDPVADRLMNTYPKEIQAMTASVNADYVPAKDLTDCFAQARSMQFAFHIMVLAKMNDEMSMADMPGYNSYELHPWQLEIWDRIDQRLSDRKRECLKDLPSAEPGMDIAFDQGNPAAVSVRKDIFRAIDRMGQSMLDQVQLDSATPPEERSRYIYLCETLQRANKVIAAIPRDSDAAYKGQYSRYADGYNKICRKANTAPAPE